MTVILYSLKSRSVFMIWAAPATEAHNWALSGQGRAQSACLISAAGPQESRPKSLSSRLITIRVSGDLESTILSVNIIQLSTVTRCPCVRGWDWGVTGSSDELWVTAGAWTLAPDTGLESHEPGQTSDPACDQLPDIWHGHQAQVPGVH